MDLAAVCQLNAQPTRRGGASRNAVTKALYMTALDMFITRLSPLASPLAADNTSESSWSLQRSPDK